MGLCPTAMNTQYQMVIDGVKQYIYDNNLQDVIKLVVQAPSGQSAVDEQVEIVEGWIQQGFDVICMCTANEGALEPIYKEASEKGIPIFEFNTPNLSMTNPYYVSNVSSDQRSAGHAIGKWMTENFKDPINIAILEGLPGVHNTERLGGFNDAIKESGATNINVVASQPADWVRDTGQTVTENLLTSHPEIELIWGLYDEMALGAVAACKDAGRTDIKIVGYDNTPDANEAIKLGEMYATVDTASKQGGYDLAEAVHKYCVKGEMVAKYITQEVVVYDVNTINDFSMDNYTYVEK
jgi:ribose transport system substrate-binding protein